jgi:hypothetical protein
MRECRSQIISKQEIKFEMVKWNMEKKIWLQSVVSLKKGDARNENCSRKVEVQVVQSQVKESI